MPAEEQRGAIPPDQFVTLRSALAGSNEESNTSLPFGLPAALAELEKGGGVSGVELAEVVERRGVEMDADQGEQRAALAVPGPEHLVVPVGVFPADAFNWVEPGEGGDEPGFQPLALHAEKLEFAHPVGGRLVSVSVERPADMEALVQALRDDSARAAR